MLAIVEIGDTVENVRVHRPAGRLFMSLVHDDSEQRTGRNG